MVNGKKKKDFSWEEEFRRDYPVENFQEINHHWWKDCYDQIEKFVLKNIPLNKNSEILECGCGSGNSSLRLALLVKSIVLFDSSYNALDCARKLANYYKVNNVEFIKGDVFSIPFESGRFDFSWNIGLIEHYSFEQAKEIIKEMLRVTKKGGWICVGVPNFVSLPIIKAKLLAFKPLILMTFWIKGYRLKDERKYNFTDFKKLFSAASRESNIKIEQISCNYIGSIFFMATPKFIFNKINKFFSKTFPRFSFLILISVRVKK